MKAHKNHSNITIDNSFTTYVPGTHFTPECGEDMIIYGKKPIPKGIACPGFHQVSNPDLSTRSPTAYHETQRTEPNKIVVSVFNFKSEGI